MIRGIGIAVSLALAGIALLCYSAPWQQVNSSGESIRELGYAPVWSHALSSVPGAEVDSDQFALFAIVIVVVAAVAGVCAYIVYGRPWWRQVGRR